MPIYEYTCPECGAEATKLVPMDAPAPTCEACAEEREESIQMKRKISESSFHLKGGGWYSDGYGS